MFFIKKLKACFLQGENNKRHKVLKAIMEAIHNEYTEDNYYTRLYWIIEQILLSDPEFKGVLDIECIKKGFAGTIDKVACIKRVIPENKKRNFDYCPICYDLTPDGPYTCPKCGKGIKIEELKKTMAILE